MKKLIWLVGFLAVFFFVGDVFGKEIKIGSGATATENVLRPIKEHFEKATGIKLTILAHGPKFALESLEKGAIDGAGIGMSYEEMLKFIKDEKIQVDTTALQHFVIGRSRVHILIHKDNPVSELSKEQIKGIFTGKITNWKEVGGKDMPIVIVWGKLTAGINKALIEQVLDRQAVTKDVLEVATAMDIKQNIAANPEAIGIGPTGVIDATIKAPKGQEVSLPILLVTKGKPSLETQRLVDFIKGEGQKYVKE